MGEQIFDYEREATKYISQRLGVPISRSNYFEYFSQSDYMHLFADCGDQQAYLGLGINYMNSGNCKAAYEYLKIAVYDRTNKSRYEMARLLYITEDYKGAIQYTEMFNDEYSYNYYQALSYYRIGEVDKCNEIMFELIKSRERDTGYLEAEKYLKKMKLIEGTVYELNSSNDLEAFRQSFKETPMRYIRYIGIIVFLSMIGAFFGGLIRSLINIAVIIITIIFYRKIYKQYARRQEEKIYTIDDFVETSRKGDRFDQYENLPSPKVSYFVRLKSSDLGAPDKKDYKVLEKHYGEYGNYYTEKDDDYSYNKARDEWLPTIASRVAKIRNARINYLLEKYQAGENRDIVEEKLRILFDLEIVDGKLKQLPRSIPYGFQKDEHYRNLGF